MSHKLFSMNPEFIVSSAEYQSFFSVLSQDSNMTDFTFNGSEDKMYAIGHDSNAVYQYTVNSIGQIESCSYDNISFSVSAQTTNTAGMKFNRDYTKMFIGDINLRRIYQYSIDLSLGIDVSTYDGKSLRTINEGPWNFMFNSDDTKIYIIDVGCGALHQYTINSLDSIDSSSYDNIALSILSQDTFFQGIDHNKDYTKLFMVGQISRGIYQYTINSLDSIDTSSYDGISLYVNTETSLRGIYIRDIDNKIYVYGGAQDGIYQYVSEIAVDINPEYDIEDNSIKIENRHRTRGASEFIYKWADQKQMSFSLEYVNSSDKSIISDFWRNNSDILFVDNNNPTDIFSCHITNKSLPIGQLNKPYNNLFKGKLKLGTY